MAEGSEPKRRLALPWPDHCTVSSLLNCISDLQTLLFVQVDDNGTRIITEDKELSGADTVEAVLDILRSYGLAPEGEV